MRPGCGNSRVHAGLNDSSRYGAANPNASAVKIANVTPADCASANPIAAPINGAVHGVATTIASTPVKKLPAYPCFDASPEPALVRVNPISNIPASDSARKNSSSAITAINSGD